VVFTIHGYESSLLGAEQVGLLLCPANEHHALHGGEALQLFVHHVVLALPLGEVDPGHRVVPGEVAHRRRELVGDARQRRGRSNR
jgi:hypothetical protein